MYKILVWLVCVCVSVSAAAQTDKWTKTDGLVQNMPEAVSKDMNLLTDYIQEHASTQEEKVRLISRWIAAHIAYDLAALSPNGQMPPPQPAVKVFAERKGVCEGYANLFQHLCDKQGIQAWVVTGYLLQDKAEGHAWNAVQLGGKWHLIDLTLASGYILNGKFRRDFNETYFLTSPDKLIRTHLPMDPAWQLLPYPVTKTEFLARQPAASASHEPIFHYADTLRRFFALDSVHRKIDMYRRALAFDPTDKITHYNYAAVRHNIGVSHLSKGNSYAQRSVQTLRQYYSLKKRGFTSLSYLNQQENTLKKLLQDTRANLRLAYQSFDNALKLNTDDENNRMARRNLDMLVSQLAFVKEELVFVDTYFKTPPARRPAVLQQYNRVLE